MPGESAQFDPLPKKRQGFFESPVLQDRAVAQTDRKTGSGVPRKVEPATSAATVRGTVLLAEGRPDQAREKAGELLVRLDSEYAMVQRVIAGNGPGKQSAADALDRSFQENFLNAGKLLEMINKGAFQSDDDRNAATRLMLNYMSAAETSLFLLLDTAVPYLEKGQKIATTGYVATGREHIEFLSGTLSRGDLDREFLSDYFAWKTDFVYAGAKEFYGMDKEDYDRQGLVFYGAHRDFVSSGRFEKLGDGWSLAVREIGKPKQGEEDAQWVERSFSKINDFSADCLELEAGIKSGIQNKMNRENGTDTPVFWGLFEVPENFRQDALAWNKVVRDASVVGMGVFGGPVGKAFERIYFSLSAGEQIIQGNELGGAIFLTALWARPLQKIVKPRLISSVVGLAGQGAGAYMLAGMGEQAYLTARQMGDFGFSNEALASLVENGIFTYVAVKGGFEARKGRAGDAGKNARETALENAEPMPMQTAAEVAEPRSAATPDAALRKPDIKAGERDDILRPFRPSESGSELQFVLHHPDFKELPFSAEVEYWRLIGSPQRMGTVPTWVYRSFRRNTENIALFHLVASGEKPAAEMSAPFSLGIGGIRKFGTTYGTVYYWRGGRSAYIGGSPQTVSKAIDAVKGKKTDAQRHEKFGLAMGFPETAVRSFAREGYYYLDFFRDIARMDAHVEPWMFFNSFFAPSRLAADGSVAERPVLERWHNTLRTNLSSEVYTRIGIESKIGAIQIIGRSRATLPKEAYSGALAGEKQLERIRAENSIAAGLILRSPEADAIRRELLLLSPESVDGYVSLAGRVAKVPVLDKELARRMGADGGAVPMVPLLSAEGARQFAIASSYLKSVESFLGRISQQAEENGKPIVLVVPLRGSDMITKTAQLLLSSQPGKLNIGKFVTTGSPSDKAVRKGDAVETFRQTIDRVCGEYEGRGGATVVIFEEISSGSTVVSFADIGKKAAAEHPSITFEICAMTDGIQNAIVGRGGTFEGNAAEFKQYALQFQRTPEILQAALGREYFRAFLKDELAVEGFVNDHAAMEHFSNVIFLSQFRNGTSRFANPFLQEWVEGLDLRSREQVSEFVAWNGGAAARAEVSTDVASLVDGHYLLPYKTGGHDLSQFKEIRKRFGNPAPGVGLQVENPISLFTMDNPLLLYEKIGGQYRAESFDPPRSAYRQEVLSFFQKLIDVERK